MPKEDYIRINETWIQLKRGKVGYALLALIIFATSFILVWQTYIIQDAWRIVVVPKSRFELIEQNQKIITEALEETIAREVVKMDQRLFELEDSIMDSAFKGGKTK